MESTRTMSARAVISAMEFTQRSELHGMFMGDVQTHSVW